MSKVSSNKYFLHSLLRKIFNVSKAKQDEIPNWIWKNSRKEPQGGKPPKPGTLEYEWWMGTQMIQVPASETFIL
jgi:hypothetical protein